MNKFGLSYISSDVHLCSEVREDAKKLGGKSDSEAEGDIGSIKYHVKVHLNLEHCLSCVSA